MSTLKIAHLNIRSLIANLACLKDYINNNSYDLICLSETWLNPTILNTAVEVDGYKLFRWDRYNQRGGGICVFVKSQLSVTVLHSFIPQLTEQLWLAIEINDISYAVGTFYRPPKQNIDDFINEFEECLGEIVPQFNNVVCCGDFNVDFLQVSSGLTKKLQSSLESFGLKQLVNKPTRLSKTTATLLDLFMCSESVDYHACDVDYNHGIPTDHCIISFLINLDKKDVVNTTITTRCLSQINEYAFNVDLYNAPFWNILHENNINAKIECFNNLILGLFNKHAPAKTFKQKKTKNDPWITPTIKLMMRLRDKALQKFRKTKSLSHWDYYKSLRNLTNYSLKREKKAYLDFKFSTNKTTKTLYRELKNLNVYSKNSINELPDTLSDVEQLNNYFISASQPNNAPCQNIINNLMVSKMDGVGNFNFSLADEDLVYKTLLSIKSNAQGNDEMNLRMLLLCSPYIIPYLTHIINFSIEHNVFPDTWKIATVMPLPKNKNPTCFKDIRPISILPTLSKVFEKIILIQVKIYLDKYNILPDTQSGFRPMHSCTTALCSVTNDIITATENSQLTLLVLLDYSKAFDTINHSLLIATLKHIGFSNTAYDLIKNYLNNRKQCVLYKNNKSIQAVVSNGVPQGSILGPVLFCIYILSFQKYLTHCKSHYYADDTQVYLSFSESETINAVKQMNEDLLALFDISQKYCLSLNPTKSQVMLFGPKKARIRVINFVDIRLNNQPLMIADSARNLGLIIDSDLRFDKQITEINKKCFSSLRLLFNSRHILNTKIKKNLCEALVLSHLNYADVVYGACLTDFNCRRLQRIQNCCVRFIYNLKRKSSVSNKLNDLAWLSITQRRFLHACTLFHKICMSKQPKYLYSKIIVRSNIHDRNIRRNYLLTIPKHQTSAFQRSFSYIICKCLNLLPLTLKTLKPLDFKRTLKKMLLEKKIVFTFKI